MKRLLYSVARRRWVKLAIQWVLSCLPVPIGFRLNQAMVNIAVGKFHHRGDLKARIEKGLRNLRLLHRKTGLQLDRRIVLEWGTGWHGIDLILFFLLGAERIHTVDHWANLEKTTMLAVIDRFRESDVRELLFAGESVGELGPQEQRLATLERLNCDLRLGELLDALHVTYHVASNCRAQSLGLPRREIDLFYSESVLQRIPEVELRSNLQFVGSELLRDGAAVFHRTDQKDINTQDHLDARLWGLDYLRYSDAFFKLFLSNRFASQNRMRESDFLDALSAAGINTIYLESYYDPADLARLETFPLAKRFRQKNLQDLANRASIMVGEYSARDAESVPLERILVKRSPTVEQPARGTPSDCPTMCPPCNYDQSGAIAFA